MKTIPKGLKKNDHIYVSEHIYVHNNYYNHDHAIHPFILYPFTGNAKKINMKHACKSTL